MVRYNQKDFVVSYKAGGAFLEQQRTLSRAVSYVGVGLHSGKEARIRLLPAEPGRGIVFRRVDLDGQPEIPARVENIVDTKRNTSLGVGNAKVMTVEHLLASLAGVGVDNAIVEVDNEEIPVGDGSSRLFCGLLHEAGIVEQSEPRRYRELMAPVYVSDHGRYMVALPADEYRISFTFVTDHPVVGTQYAEYAITPQIFEREIAPARTIGFAEQIEAMRRDGLAIGGNLDLAVVVGQDGYLNPRRYPDEIVRHKILDIIGDLSLVGPLRAHIIAIKSGHQVDAMLAKELVKSLNVAQAD